MNNDRGPGRIRCWREKGISGDGSCPKLAVLIHCRHCPVYTAASRQRLDRELPAGYLEERTVVMARQKEAATPGTLSVMAFRLKDERFALKTIFFQEAAEIAPVHTIPSKTNRIFKGVVNINGELLLCISVADLLELTGKAENMEGRTVYERMIVVCREGNRFVFPVDEIFGVHRISPEDMRDVPATLSRSTRVLTQGIFALDGRNVGLLDEDQFFPAMTRSLTS
ncbi:MAG: chemotaxis protein CheW [Deltaproteobacteria bacterium]|nr:chemotaxis protein CheW [Deltaproteobacteria bacterium]